MTNGTIAIQMAIKALELKGEIITTPFTWVATLSAIKWEGCTPVFCDIEADTFNIDPVKIEAAITDQTVAIMPVHVFGNPCDVEAIEAIAHGDESTSKVVGRSIQELKLPPRTTIGAIVRGNEVLIAHDNRVIESNDHVILFLVDKKYISEVEKLFQVNAFFL